MNAAVEESRIQCDGWVLGRRGCINPSYEALAHPVEAASVGGIKTPSAIVDAVKCRRQFVTQTQVHGETRCDANVILREEVPVGAEGVEIINAERIGARKVTGIAQQHIGDGVAEPRAESRTGSDVAARCSPITVRRVLAVEADRAIAQVVVLLEFP